MIEESEPPYLRRCVELAAEALEAGDEPFGSVLVRGDGTVLAEHHDRVAGGDRTRHPEFEPARWSAAPLTPGERAAATVCTSGEHCPMCAAAHAWVGLGRIVHVASSAQLGTWLEEWGAAAPPVRPLPGARGGPRSDRGGPGPGADRRGTRTAPTVPRRLSPAAGTRPAPVRRSADACPTLGSPRSTVRRPGSTTSAQSGGPAPQHPPSRRPGIYPVLRQLGPTTPRARRLGPAPRPAARPGDIHPPGGSARRHPPARRLGPTPPTHPAAVPDRRFHRAAEYGASSAGRRVRTAGPRSAGACGSPR